MPNWEEHYVVKKTFSKGALILMEMDRKEFPNPINSDVVRKYYVEITELEKRFKLKTRKNGDATKLQVHNIANK